MNYNLVRKLNYHLFKRKMDKDLYDIYTLSHSVSYRSVKNIPLKNIRSAKITTKFINLKEYLNSMNQTKSHMLKRDLIKNIMLLNLDTKNIYLEDWIEIDNPNYLLISHKKIVKSITEIIDEIYGFYGTDDELFRYYKRLNILYFHQLTNWINTIKAIQRG